MEAQRDKMQERNEQNLRDSCVVVQYQGVSCMHNLSTRVDKGEKIFTEIMVEEILMT